MDYLGLQEDDEDKEMVSDDIWWKFVVVSMKCGFMMFFFGLKIEMKKKKEENGNWV